MAAANHEPQRGRRASPTIKLLLPVSESDASVHVEVVAEPVPVVIPARAVLIAVRDVAIAIAVDHEMCGESPAPPSLDHSWD